MEKKNIIRTSIFTYANPESRNKLIIGVNDVAREMTNGSKEKAREIITEELGAYICGKVKGAERTIKKIIYTGDKAIIYLNPVME